MTLVTTHMNNFKGLPSAMNNEQKINHQQWTMFAICMLMRLDILVNVIFGRSSRSLSIYSYYSTYQCCNIGLWFFVKLEMNSKTKCCFESIPYFQNNTLFWLNCLYWSWIIDVYAGFMVNTHSIVIYRPWNPYPEFQGEDLGL